MSGCAGSASTAAHTPTPQPTPASTSPCANTALNAGAVLPHVASHTLAVPGDPFTSPAAPGGQALFVALDSQQETAGSIAVLTASGSAW